MAPAFLSLCKLHAILGGSRCSAPQEERLSAEGLPRTTVAHNGTSSTSWGRSKTDATKLVRPGSKLAAAAAGGTIVVRPGQAHCEDRSVSIPRPPPAAVWAECTTRRSIHGAGGCDGTSQIMPTPSAACVPDNGSSSPSTTGRGTNNLQHRCLTRAARDSSSFRRPLIYPPDLVYTPSCSAALDARVRACRRVPEGGVSEHDLWAEIFRREDELLVPHQAATFQEDSVPYRQRRRGHLSALSDSTTASSVSDVVLSTTTDVAPQPTLVGVRQDMRTSVVRWMSNVVMNMRWKRATFFIAVHALDTYLACVASGAWPPPTALRIQLPPTNNERRDDIVAEEILPVLSTAALFLGVSAEEEHVHAHRVKSFVKKVPNLASIHQVFVQQLDILSCLTHGLLITRTPEDFLYYFLANMRAATSTDHPHYARMYAELMQPAAAAEDHHVAVSSLQLLVESVLLIATAVYETGVYAVRRASHLVAACMTPMLAASVAPELGRSIQSLTDFADAILKFALPHQLAHVILQWQDPLRSVVRELAPDHQMIGKFLESVATFSVPTVSKYIVVCSESPCLVQLDDGGSTSSGTPQLASGSSCRSSMLSSACCRPSFPTSSYGRCSASPPSLVVASSATDRSTVRLTGGQDSSACCPDKRGGGRSNIVVDADHRFSF